MLRLLCDRQHTVGQLAEPFHMSLAAASKHIKALEAAGLIQRDVQGRTHLCQLNAGPLAAASEWIAQYERFWTARLDKLEALLRRDSAADSTAKHAAPNLGATGAGRQEQPTPKQPTPKKRSSR